jgi:hypothetical protein
MRDITEHTVLSRVTVKLPNNLTVETEDFLEGWSFLRSGDLHWVDKEIRKCGWHFIWIADSSQRGGVGQTEQAAIAAALKLALRRVSPDFNAANVDTIELVQYPWFFIAKVRVYPYQIQQDVVLLTSEKDMPPPITPVEAISETDALVVGAA